MKTMKTMKIVANDKASDLCRQLGKEVLTCVLVQLKKKKKNVE